MTPSQRETIDEAMVSLERLSTFVVLNGADAAFRSDLLTIARAIGAFEGAIQAVDEFVAATR
jgi:hypothetical protein